MEFLITNANVVDTKCRILINDFNSFCNIANDCKVAWRSLRQSYRYHCKAANSRFKIDGDDDEGEVDPLETRDIQWEFANHMAFLKEMSKKKR